jgi:hypothetical protein
VTKVRIVVCRCLHTYQTVGLSIVVCWCLHTYQTVRSQYCSMLVSAYLPDCTVSVLWYVGFCIRTGLYGLSIVVCWCLIRTRMYGLSIVVCWCPHTYPVRSQYWGVLVSAYLPDCTVSVLWYAGICIHTRLYGLRIEDVISLI